MNAKSKNVRNVLIGIGGTGSRIVESCLALFASGLGPRDGVHIALIDQDGDNGNGGRTDRLLKAILRLQSRIPCQVGGFPGIPIGTFRYDSFRWDDQVDFNWKPDIHNQTLTQLLNMDHSSEAQKTLFAHLYDQEEAVAQVTLGFKGHANVGSAAVYAALLDPAGEFNKRMDAFVSADAGGLNLEVRFFLVGSIFGGMGASGFPTIARRLRLLRDQFPNAEIRLGGALMLPYFTFKDDDEDAFALKAREVLQNSRQALEFYAELFEDDVGVFDRFYLSGWNDLFALDYGRRGGPEQKNPPMPPELYAAAAVHEFFSLQEIEKAGPSAPPIFVTGRDDTDKVDWGDLTNEAEIRPALGRLLRLAAYWRYSLDPELRSAAPVPTEWRKLVGKVDPDILDLLVDIKNSDADKNGVFDLLLGWAAGMQIFAKTDKGLNFRWWDVCCATGDTRSPEKGVSLGEAPAGQVYDALIASVERDACDLYADINRAGAQMPAETPGEMTTLLQTVDTAARIA